MAFIDFDNEEDKRYQNFVSDDAGLTEVQNKISEVQSKIDALVKKRGYWKWFYDQCLKQNSGVASKCKNLSRQPEEGGASKNVLDTWNWIVKEISAKEGELKRLKQKETELKNSPESSSSNSSGSGMFKKVNSDGTTSPNYILIGGIALGLTVLTIVAIKLIKKK